tara:strand:+ start:522 stop:1799 length:1278 start_codon:yes stop_codon:yes gene_type:complete
MDENSNIFTNKRILIYGLGKSGLSSVNFLRKKKNKVYLYDDYKKNLISGNQIKNFQFDAIIISPGIDINNCKLSKFLNKNLKIIYTDLDVFYSFHKNLCITITGTNGKSTTCQLLHEVLKKQKIDVRLGGNIGKPILSIKNFNNKTVFVIEASSYQLEYSKLFKSKYAAILNISPDHLERHQTIQKYIKAKLKLVKNQSQNSLAFINKNDNRIMSKLKKTKYKSKIILVDTNLKKKSLSKFKNENFLSRSNIENLSFVIRLAKIFKIKKKNLIEAVRNFKGLKYRQQIIFENKNLTIINDSKSTSYSSSAEILKEKKNIYWLVGGIPKRGDKFDLPKNYYKKIKGYVFGRNKKKFLSDLKKKIRLKKFLDLKKAWIELSQDVKNDNSKNKTILFSPAAASFDNFNNFEDRGKYFNKLVKEYKNGI